MALVQRLAPALGLALLGALVAVEALAPDLPVIATFAIAPFLAALGGTLAEVALIGALATLAALTAPTWSDVPGDTAWAVRSTAVLAGSLFALFAVRQRQAADDAHEELDAALSNLADAVTVQSPEGRLVYANLAAAEMLGYASPEELVATPPAQIISRYDSYTEDGQPLDPAVLPGRRVLRGEQPPPLLVRAVNRETGEERWQVVKARAVPAGPRRELRAINVIEDVTESKRAEIAQRLLSEASRALSSSLEYETTLQRVAEMAVPTFADWCSVSVPRDDGTLELVAVAHADPEKARYGRELRERYPARLDDPGMEGLLAGRSELTEITPEMLRQFARDEGHERVLSELGLRSSIRVPMFSGGELIGVLGFVTSSMGRVFNREDLAVAEELARRAAVAIQNARLFAERSRAAQALVSALRPQALAPIPGWRTASLYEPAAGGGEVGGDFYDAFEVPGGWIVAIGDVVGRGVEAAALTSMARYTLRTACSLDADPAAALGQLNRWLLERSESAICTVAMARLGPEGMVELFSAGHPPAIVVAGGAASQWDAEGPILGAFEAASWKPSARRLAERELLVLYTDGLFELPGCGERFGEDRLRGVLARATDPRQAVQITVDELERFAEREFPDDMALLALQRES